MLLWSIEALSRVLRTENHLSTFLWIVIKSPYLPSSLFEVIIWATVIKLHKFAQYKSLLNGEFVVWQVSHLHVSFQCSVYQKLLCWKSTLVKIPVPFNHPSKHQNQHIRHPASCAHLTHRWELHRIIPNPSTHAFLPPSLTQRSKQRAGNATLSSTSPLTKTTLFPPMIKSNICKLPPMHMQKQSFIYSVELIT